ncbi:MAG: collagen-like protein, partial [Nitrospirae bacterium]
MERHNRLSRLRRAKELSKVVPVIKGEPIIIKGEPGERGEPGDPGKDADVEKVKDELIQDISPLIPSTKKVVEKVLSQIKVPRGERGLPGQRGERGAQGAQGSKGLNWQGQWKIDNDYSLDDGVYNDGSAFICVKAHISSKINEPVAGMNWKEFWNVMAEQGVQGAGGKAGTPGANGVGVPTGGTTNQVLKKASNADYDTTWGAASGGGSWGSIAGTLSDQTDLQTALDAKQASDADLTAIAGLDSSTSGAIASDGAGWIKKTYAQFKTALSLVKGDVGLGSVDNTADSAKNVLSATKLTTARNIDGQSFDGSADITVIAPGTHAATSKTTPVDADELPLVDSAAANVLKKLTWANLKATIKAYTDTLYPSGSGTSSGSNTGDQTISDATISTTDITTNDVSTSKHGFAPKAVAPASGNLNVYGIANAETAIANKLLLDTTTPSTQAYGDAAAAGTSLKAARVDHKHAMPASTKDTTAQTGLLKGDGSAISAVTAPAGTVVGTSDSQTLTNKDLSSATNTFPTFDKTNYALNGNMQFWQRNLTPTTLFDPIYKGTTLSTTVDAYGPDQFKIAEENAKVQVNQTDTNGSA